MSDASVQFYLDEHIENAIARGLRQRGVDVLTVVEAGMIGATDKEHIKFARNQNRVIVTYDDDFLRLASEDIPHAGIVYAPHSRTIGSKIQGLLLITQVMTTQEMQGHIEFM